MPNFGSNNYRTYHGIYKLKNKEKYIGSEPPQYRSSWEAKMFAYCDENKNIIRWSSESIKIPYAWPDGSLHTYYPDIYMEIVDNSNQIKKYLIEIKPHGQGPFANNKGEVKFPQKPKNNNPKAMKRYINEMFNYKKNELKWNAAQAFCAKSGIEFKILSDEDFV